MSAKGDQLNDADARAGDAAPEVVAIEKDAVRRLRRQAWRERRWFAAILLTVRFRRIVEIRLELRRPEAAHEIEAHNPFVYTMR